MSMVSGSLIKSKPISLNKAASILNEFFSKDNGSPQAISVFLKRASKSFNDLVQLHRELKTGGKSKRKSNKKKKKKSSLLLENGYMKDERNPSRGVGEGKVSDLVGMQSENHEGGYGEEEDIGESSGKKNKRKKKKNETGVEVEEEKKRKKVEVEGGRLGNSEERHRGKKEKKVEVGDGNMGSSEERHSRKKKKKKLNVEDGSLGNSEEGHSRKKKSGKFGGGA